MIRYKFPCNKELYIANNDPKQPVLLYRDEDRDSGTGCQVPPDVIEYYHIDWNNQNEDGPFITSLTGGTILFIDLFFLKFFKKIRKPNKGQEEIIRKYGFYEMLDKFDKERINAGYYKVDEKS